MREARTLTRYALDVCQNDSIAPFCFGSPGVEGQVGGVIPSFRSNLSIFWAKGLLDFGPVFDGGAAAGFVKAFEFDTDPLLMAVEPKEPNVGGAGDLDLAIWLGVLREDDAGLLENDPVNDPPNGAGAGWPEKGLEPFELPFVPFVLDGAPLKGLLEDGFEGAPKAVEGECCNPYVAEIVGRELCGLPNMLVEG